MRKIFIVAIFIFSFTVANAQKVQSADTAFVTQTISDVIGLAVNKYSVSYIDSQRKTLSVTLLSGTNELSVSFFRNANGGNTDLGIPDTLVYRFAGVRGIYKDVFPYWQKIFDATAGFEATATEGHGRPQTFTCNGVGYIARLNKYAHVWMLEVVKK